MQAGAVFEVETAMPLPPEWRVRLSLSPVTPQPAIDYVDGGLELSDLSSPQVVEIDGRGAELSLARGGTFEIAWSRRYCEPDAIISDRGSQMESKKFEDFCAARNISRGRTTIERPQTNSNSERVHRWL